MKQEKTRHTLISKLANQNDEEAWAEFVSYYEEYLKRVLAKYGLTPEEVHDFVQSTLLIIWKKLPGFQYDPSKGRFRSWIAQIAINEMRSTVRKEVKLREAIEKKVTLTGGMDDLRNDLEEEWQLFLSQKAWENISSDLSETMRQAFSLHIEGLTSPQIAEKLEISESSARVYKQRVTYKLKYEIARLDQELG